MGGGFTLFSRRKQPQQLHYRAESYQRIQMPQNNEPLPQIRDLFDFYNQWVHLRQDMVTLVASDRLTQRERLIIKLMIELTDRVGPTDLDRA